MAAKNGRTARHVRKEATAITIEQKLLHDRGITNDPYLTVWMLADGTMVNGSYEGRQRDVDHHEIGQYFKRSKYEDPGSSAIYIAKFMRRGNIRMGCSPCGACAEFRRTPTQEQLNALCRIMGEAEDNRVETVVTRRNAKGERVHETFGQFLRYVSTYLEQLVIPSRAYEYMT